jgi:hypothetical protein
LLKCYNKFVRIFSLRASRLWERRLSYPVHISYSFSVLSTNLPRAKAQTHYKGGCRICLGVEFQTHKRTRVDRRVLCLKPRSKCIQGVTHLRYDVTRCSFSDSSLSSTSRPTSRPLICVTYLANYF